MMCCGDWKMLVILGDANEESLYRIWHGNKMNNIRNLHLNSKINNISACRICTELDSFKLKK